MSALQVANSLHFAFSLPPRDLGVFGLQLLLDLDFGKWEGDFSFLAIITHHPPSPSLSPTIIPAASPAQHQPVE